MIRREPIILLSNRQRGIQFMSTHVHHKGTDKNTNAFFNTTILVNTEGITQLVTNKRFLSVLSIALGPAILGLIIAAIANWCNFGRIF